MFSTAVVFGCGSSVAIVLGWNLLKRALCSGQQRRFVAPHESEGEAERDAAEDETSDGERALQPRELFSRNVGAYAEDGCPHDPTRYVEEQEAAPGHVVDARQERRDRSEKRQESSEEHHGSAVPREQVPSELQTAGIEPQIPAIPLQETPSVSLANPEADVVADDGSHTGGGHDETDVEAVRGSGVDSCRHKSGFTGEGKPHALQTDNRGHDNVAVRRDQ